MQAEVVLQRLEDGGLTQLSTLIVDDLLGRPVADMLEPNWVARQVVEALRAVSSGDQTERWIASRIERLRDQVPEGSVGDRVPPEVADPLMEVVGTAYLPDRELVGRLLDHDTVRRLFKDVLVGAIEKFVARISTGRGRLGKLRALGEKALHESALGGLSQEIERQAEHRIREFVEGAIDAVVTQVGDHICEDGFIDKYSAYRQHFVEVLLATPMETFAAEVDKLDPGHLVATGTAIARALAERDGFVEEVEAVAAEVLQASQGRSVADYLAEAGITDAWRADVQGMLEQRGRDLIQTTAFADWLEELLSNRHDVAGGGPT